MPGDYTVDLGARTGYMITYGAGKISVSSPGMEYKLKKGSTATITIPINPYQLKHQKNQNPKYPFYAFTLR